MMKPKKNAAVNETSFSTWWFDEDGILRAVLKNNTEEGLEERRRNFREFRQKMGGRKVCLIADISHSSPISRKIQTFNLENYPEIFKAIAFISDSAYSKMLAHLFLGMHNQVLPFRIFSTEEEAVQWIKEYNK